MHLAVHILSILVLFMLAGVIPAGQGEQGVVFRTPVFVVLLGVLVFSILSCSRRYRFSRRTVGFFLTHYGVVAILGGAFAGYVLGERGELAVPITAHHTLWELTGGDGTTVPFGFGVSVTAFDVRFYDPDYDLYRIVSAADRTGETGEGSDGAEYEYVARFTLSREGRLDLGEFGYVGGTDLRADSGAGDWVEQHVLPNGWVLQKAPGAPRRYAATLKITDADGSTREEELIVNQPVQHRGWRLYLMSYDQEAKRYVVLSVRRDPGRTAVILGIWALMAGVALMCFRKSGGANGAA